MAPSFQHAPLAPPSRAPSPAEIHACVVQLLPPVASPPSVDLLPLVMPLLSVLRCWNVHLRAEARRALEVVPADEKKLRKRLTVLSKEKTEVGLEEKLNGFGIMVGLWRVQNAILDGTTSKADLQPLIDDFFPPAPLPPSFLTSDTSPLSSERRQEVENTVLRTRRTCQALRKKAALIAKSHAGTPKSLRSALLEARIADGPIALAPTRLDGDEGTARAILTQARNVQNAWEELERLFPLLPSEAPGEVKRSRSPQPFVQVEASQESIIEDSQKAQDAHILQEELELPRPSYDSLFDEPMLPFDLPSVGQPSIDITRVASALLPQPSPRTSTFAPPARLAPADVTKRKLSAPRVSQPKRRTMSILAPAPDKPPSRLTQVKRGINRYSILTGIDSTSSSEDDSDVAPAPKKARADGHRRENGSASAFDGSQVANTAFEVDSQEADAWLRVNQGSIPTSWPASKNGSQGTTDSSLGYVDLPMGSIPRPRDPSPRLEFRRN